MTDIALFHSVLCIRPGVAEAADRFRTAGHDVLVVDQYEGQVFDDYDEQAADLLWSRIPPFCAAPRR